MSLSSPGHAVLLFWSQRFWEAFTVRSRGFAGRDAQTQLKVQTVDLEAKSSLFRGSGRNVSHWRSPQRRSKNDVLELARPCCFAVLKPAFLGRLLGQKLWFCWSWRPNATEGANGGSRSQILSFRHSGRNGWHWRSPQRRSKNGVLELARPCCFAVLKPAFLGRLLGQTSCFCRSWRPNALEGANGGYRSQISFFIGSGRDVWHWRSPQHRSKNGVLELARPCCFAVLKPAFLGSLYGQKSWFCRSWTPKRNWRCKRWISKPNPHFL